jgi:DNA polymerase-3 subunit beta
MMKIRCKQTELSQVLSMVNRAVSPNNTLPVLNNILLRAEKGELILSATNLEIAIKASIEATVEIEGSVTVPAKAFSSYVSLLRDEEINLQVKKGNTIEVESTGSETKMKGISSEEFPLLPELKDPQVFKLPTEGLKQAIEQVVFAASTNISRPVLTGVFCKISGKTMKLAATDSYRLAEKTMIYEEDLGIEIQFIIPAKTAQELAKAISYAKEDSIEIQVNKGQVVFMIGSVQILSRLIEGNYPNYEQILPKESKTSAVLTREDFTLALKKISVIVRENNNNVKLAVESGKIKLQSDETQVGEGSAEIEAATGGDDQLAALNAQYLLDVLGHIGTESVYLGLNDGLSPVKVVPADSESENGGGYLHIIMPLKV